MAQEIPAERHCATFLIDYHGLAVLAVRQLLDSIEAREAGGGVQNPVSGLAPQKSFLGRFEGIEIDLKKHGFLLRRAWLPIEPNLVQLRRLAGSGSVLKNHCAVCPFNTRWTSFTACSSTTGRSIRSTWAKVCAWESSSEARRSASSLPSPPSNTTVSNTAPSS